MKSIAAILGSAFGRSIPKALAMQQIHIDTKWGTQALFASTGANGRRIFAIIRHKSPHKLLPNQINYRAQAAALKAVDCGALLINSSVGVLDPGLPLFTPMLLTDQLMPDNRLPDGSTCTMFVEPSKEQGHLVLNEGLFSTELSNQIYERHPKIIHAPERELVFVYAGGPRGKTAAENHMWAQLGGHVNSMTVAPEAVLANELEIPVAGLVVGHKYSVPGRDNPPEADLQDSLKKARKATEEILISFLKHGDPVKFGNHIYRF
ncbi:MAG: hypothetical protein PVH63_11915 [Balneolaceae bacterium]|jgi:purine nucleoside phosphorylase